MGAPRLDSPWVHKKYKEIMTKEEYQQAIEELEIQKRICDWYDDLEEMPEEERSQFVSCFGEKSYFEEEN